jgi:hypothetical protein
LFDSVGTVFLLPAQEKVLIKAEYIAAIANKFTWNVVIVALLVISVKIVIVKRKFRMLKITKPVEFYAIL